MNRNFNIIALIIFSSFFFSCKQENNVPNQPKEIIAVNENKKVTEIEEDEKTYYNYDTLLIKKYISQSGNKIELRGSKSKDLYNIKLNGITYKIADNWYEASHQYIVWDNKDFIFLRYGCGTECWGGKVINVREKTKVREFQYYLYTDSVKNYIVYPDSLDMDKIYFENINTKQKKTVKFDLCEEAVLPILTIDTIFEIPGKKLIVKYTDKECKQKKEKIVELN